MSDVASCDPWNVEAGQQVVRKRFPYVYNHDQRDIKYIISEECLQFIIIRVKESFKET